MGCLESPLSRSVIDVHAVWVHETLTSTDRVESRQPVHALVDILLVTQSVAVEAGDVGVAALLMSFLGGADGNVDVLFVRSDFRRLPREVSIDKASSVVEMTQYPDAGNADGRATIATHRCC